MGEGHLRQGDGFWAGKPRRYLCIDYGLDMFSAHWVALDARGRARVYPYAGEVRRALEAKKQQEQEQMAMMRQATMQPQMEGGQENAMPLM